MNKFGATLIRVVALAGGAIVGVYLAKIANKLMDTQTQAQHDDEKSRYAQGLTVSFQSLTGQRSYSDGRYPPTVYH
jgi:hypothetical protein